MDNYYNILGISPNSTTNEIHASYQNKIIQFNNLPFLNKDQGEQVKKLKKAIFVLSTPHLKKNYDSKILFDTNNEIKCLNSFDNEDTLETQFAQSLLNGSPSHDDKTSEKVNASILGQRIFSLSHMNKTPELNEFNLELRKPQTSRIDKTIEN